MTKKIMTIPLERVIVRKENLKMIFMCWQISRECLTLVKLVQNIVVIEFFQIFSF